MKYKILKGRKLVDADLMTWAKWHEDIRNRRVDYTKSSNGWRVSTVCLGLDHSFGYGPELYFETMVFGSNTELDNEPFRYSTLKEAEKGHKEIVSKIKELLAKK